MSLNKADYIKLHGEEAWPAEQERRRVRSRKYYLKNRDAIQAQHREYKEAHLDEYIAYRKKYYQDKKEQIKDKVRKRYQDNREDKLKYWAEYRKNNIEAINQKNKDYRDTKNGRASYLRMGYLKMDTDRGFKRGDVTQKWILDNIFNSKCIYCGDSNWRHLGCDRIDNTKPHDKDNIVCSCGLCNAERASKNMSVEEFIEYRKTNPRILGREKLEEIVEVNGKYVIRKIQK